ncbi:MAG TPA: restriction endonuclease, partial [Burkholderiales bacterium]|nr:restriction endonuclease [Burkholderiales bacterium]
RFRAYKFPAHLFEMARPHPKSLSDPEPRKITITADNTVMRDGADIAAVYARAKNACEFPCDAPALRYGSEGAPPPKPRFPDVKLPPKVRVRLVAVDGREIVGDEEPHGRAYMYELDKVASLNSQTELLQQTFEQKYAEATEAYELLEIYLADLALKWRDAEGALLREFETTKAAYERECQSVTQPIRAVFERYRQRTSEGLQSHFEFALCNLSLPIPNDYPWQVLCDPAERLLQVNQCVPSLADVTVVRQDSKRPPAKRDTEAALRRFVPAIALQLAHHVAVNDIQGDIDKIVVNCWSRFFEPSTGQIKSAFVASLIAEKRALAEINLQRADALEAFRALRGSYVFNTEEVVPIEPAIRLDKEDDRFVAGRDVLDGMAQGQNLAAMDWQDFEHLIRELLAKEYAHANAEVKITRASRDRGVDAVVFNSDPLHGGKFVVQAKRYSNTVDVAAVRELYGTVLNEGANRGILVTTSHFGRDAHEWAANKPLTLIDGQNLLALLTKHGYNFKIKDVREAKL